MEEAHLRKFQQMSKSELKAVHKAIKAEQWQEAQDRSESILADDPANVSALLFSGLALQNLAQFKESFKAFQKAVEAAPDAAAGYNALCGLLELWNNDEHRARLDSVYLKQIDLNSDPVRTVETIGKLISLREDGLDLSNERSLDDLMTAESLLLPSSAYYDRIKDLPDLPSPSSILVKMATRIENNEERTRKSEVDKRRMRLGADTLANIRTQVQKEIVQKSRVHILCIF